MGYFRLEQRWVILVQGLKHMLHSGLADEGATGFHAEAFAVFVEHGKFLFVEENRLARAAPEGRPLLVVIAGVDS